LNASPFLLNATLRHHVSKYLETDPEFVKVLESLYVDDLVSGYTDILPNVQFAERTLCRTDNLLKIEMLFRQNVWDCDSFLNCVILNHCVK
jgi:hypothetical protein